MKISTPVGFVIRSLVLMAGLFMFNKASLAQFQINAAATNYTQDFNSLTTAGAWSDNTTLTGWYARTDATATIASYGLNTGTTTTAGLYSYGIAGTNPVTERALGYATSNGFTGTAGTGKNYLGWRLVNNTGSAISSIQVTWTGEQWRRDNTVAQSLVLSYQQGATVTTVVGTGWTSTGSTFTSPNLGAGAATDGNASGNRSANITATITVNIPAGQEIMLRWEDVNDANNDHHMAIDDVTINATAAIVGSAPTVTTTTATAITTTGATSGGDVTADGGQPVTARGVAYGLSASPTTSGTATSDGSGTGVFVSSLSGLAVNTQYFYRAYATNVIGTSYGSESSFYTLANTPGAPVVNGATTSSLDVTVTPNSNPASTQFAIQETGSSNYVQSNGTLGASPVWQTVSTWGTVTVTGLAANTAYTFQVNARNGANVETGFGATTTLSTMAMNAPTLQASALAGFGSVCINTSSAANTFTITGANLTTADVTVGPLTGYSFSKNGVDYFPSLTYTQGGGAFSETVSVVFTPTAVQSYDGNIPVAGGGASATEVAATGSGINTAVSVTTGTASAITQQSASVSGSYVAGCSAVSAYGIEYSTTNNFTPGSGTQSAGGPLTGNNFSSALSGLAPNTTYYFRAYATDGSGTVYDAQGSFATTALDAPVATAAEDITGTSFTATWEAVPGATSYRLDVSTSPTFGSNTTATDLIFSEYVEGSSNNKYIEIYNGTGSSVNLGDYRLRLYTNGSNTTTSDVLLSGSLADGATIVYKNGSAAAYAGAATTNGAVNYNGDDAVVLFKVSTASIVDVFGNIGEDPGVAWTGGGNSTLDKTLVRKSTVTGGVTVDPVTGFPTLATEWDQFNIDDVSHLGSHTFQAFTPSFLPGYENLTVNGLSQAVSGLAPNTTYYYRVRAFSPTSTSPNSNTITVQTSCEASVNASAGANGTISPDGGSTYNCGDDPVYTITPAACYSVEDVIVDGVSQGPITTYTFTDIAGGAHTITATFVLSTYTITATAGTGGSISPATGPVNCGSNQQYTITPDACFAIADVLVDGISQGPLTEFTFTNVTATHTISASFAPITYTITATAGANGSISPATGSVNCGANASYTITPNACFTVADVIVDGVSQGAVTSYTFTNVQSNHTISATFVASPSITNPVVSGPTNICQYIGTGEPVEYTATATGATGFTWVAPPNVTIVSGQGTGTLRVTFANGFAAQANKQLRVTATSSCGNSAQVIYYLLAQAPNTPQPITGNTNVCPIIGTGNTYTYTIPAVVGATSYVWSAQAGTTVVTNNGTSADISFSNGFTTSAVTVSAVNGCGTSSARSLVITRTNPSTPGLISGPTNVCSNIAPNGTAASYSVPSVAGVTYTWTLPAGATNITGQGTNSISFVYPAGFTSGVISVSATNNCGTSGNRSLSVTRLTPSAPSQIDVIQTQPCPDRIYTYTIAGMPANATDILWTVPAGGTILSGQGTTSISVSYASTAINGTVTATANNNCGSSATRSTPVRLPACEVVPPPPFAKGGVIPAFSVEQLAVTVYPNPSTADFKLQVSANVSNGKVTAKIMDMQGRNIQQFVTTPFQMISIGSKLKAGSYLLQIQQGNELRTVKLIKF